jgi:allophanate hydrolase
MRGLPLNRQIRELGGRFIEAARTAPSYRLYALPGGPPHRPGLVRVGDAGDAIEVETWTLPAAQVGSFLAGIPAPLGIGRIELESGDWQLGFLCEAFATQGALDITHHGGWRAYLGQTGSYGPVQV